MSNPDTLKIPYSFTTTYTFSRDNEFAVDDEKPLAFLKQIGSNISSPNVDVNYSPNSIIVQNFSYYENGELKNKSIDGIINKDSLKKLYNTYYKNLENSEDPKPTTVIEYINECYDFYTAVETVQRLCSQTDELNAFTKQINKNPSEQDLFFQMYNDYAAVNVSDANSQVPFCTKIYRANIDNTEPGDYDVSYVESVGYITNNIFPVFFYKLASGQSGNLTCHIECRNIKIPYKVLKIDDYNFMCIMPEYLLKNINPAIYRKLIFNLNGVILKPNNASFNIDINQNMLNANVLTEISVPGYIEDQFIEGNEQEQVVAEESVL